MSERKLFLRALDVLTEGGDAPVRESFRSEALDTAREARAWTRGKGVQGLGIAEKVTDGQPLGSLALKVYVEKKLPKKQVSGIVPAKVHVPGLDDELPTDVEEIGRIIVESNTSRVRPAIPGFSTAHSKFTAGTFGCLVRKLGSKPIYMLSNSHVFALVGHAKKGDAILQQSPSDGGRSPSETLAKLYEFVPFALGGAFPNLVDAAIASVAKTEVTSRIRRIGVPLGISRVVRRDMKVQKTGRTTDHTIGIVRDIDFRTTISYKKPGGGTIRVGFRDQVLCSRYTSDGDSGSAVLSLSGNVVGLHFAGSATASVFNKIGNVLDALNLEIVTETF